MSNLIDEATELTPDMIEIRRDIHAHPELGMEEHRTSALVAGKLREWGLEVTEGVGRLGVVGTLRGRLRGQRAISLRADMDALPINEKSGKPWSSEVPGTMHACGHDGHTAMLLGAARLLSRRADFAGTVHFIFQPAEEGARGGAKAMLADKLFERFPTDAVYGMHNWPNAPLGKFLTRTGPTMAAGDRWWITIRGTGGHGGANPHSSTDVLVAQAMFIAALQTIVSRNVSAVDTAVISVGTVQGGSPLALNVMPSEVLVGGVTRSHRPEVRDAIESRIRELADSVSRTFGCSAEVKYLRHGTALINHAEETNAAVAAAAALVGNDEVESNMPPVNAGEDFANMLMAKPGNFIFLGQGPGPGVHQDDYDFNDEAIPFGIGYWATLVYQQLRAPL